MYKISVLLYFNADQQIAVVIEGIAAVIMLMKCSQKVPLSGSLSAKMWNYLEILSQCISSKFIGGSQDADLIHLLRLGKHLFKHSCYELPKSILK